MTSPLAQPGPPARSGPRAGRPPRSRTGPLAQGGRLASAGPLAGTSRTMADRLAIQHQLGVATVAGGVVSVVASAALGADPLAVSTWFWGVVDGLISRIQAGYALNRNAAMQFLPRHGALNGVGVQAVPGSLDVARLRQRLHITGPVAFKTAIAGGADTDQALRSMSTQMSGVADEYVRNGDRDVITQTAQRGRGVVGWRRRLSGRACGFCSMLASRGAVYFDRKTATVAKDGAAYHPHCHCWAEPLYSHQQEPPYVRELQRQWSRVTAGHSGPDAQKVWRRHWETRATPRARERMGIAESLPGRGGAGTPAPAGIEVRPVLAEARDVAGVQLAFWRETGRISGVRLDPKYIDFAGSSVQTAREHAEGILRGLERFPDARFRGVFTDLPEGQRYAHASGPDITFSRRWSSPAARDKYLRALSEDATNGWHTPGSGSPVAIALHEFGHIIDLHTLGRAVRTDLDELLIRRAAEAGTTIGELIRTQVSGYAFRNLDELVAESFVDVMLRGQAASRLSREIFDLVEAEYRRTGRRAGVSAVAESTPGLSRLSVADLRKMVTARGITVPTGIRKPALVRLVDDLESGVDPAVARARAVEGLAPAKVAAKAATPAKAAKAVPTKATPARPLTPAEFDRALGAATSGDDALRAARVELRTAAERAAYADYVSQYRFVNGTLRENAGQIPAGRAFAADRRLAAGLDSAFARSGLAEDLQLYRISGTIEFPDGIPRVGAEWTDHGYVSTSVRPKPDARRGDVEMRILAPAGTRAVATSELDVGEVLLGRGQQYRVVRVAEPDARGVWRVDVEVVPARTPAKAAVKKAAPAKKVAPPPAKPLTVAQREQVAMDSARELAEQAAEVETLVANQGSARAVVSTVRSRMRRLKIEPVDASGEFLSGTNGTAARYVWRRPGGDVDLTGARGLSVDPAVREIQIENRIRQAYEEAVAAGARGYLGRPVGRPGAAVRLSEVRERLSDLDRTEVDAALRRIGRQDGLALGIDEAAFSLTPADRAASIRYGGESITMFQLKDAAARRLRPVPAATRDVDLSRPRPRDVTAEEFAAAKKLADTALEVERLSADGVTDALTAAVRRRAARQKLTPSAKAGEVVPYDPATMDVIGPPPAKGTYVLVRRPGYSWKRPDGKVVTVDRVTVQDAATPQQIAAARAAAAPKAAKKAAPRAARTPGVSPEDVQIGDVMPGSGNIGVTVNGNRAGIIVVQDGRISHLELAGQPRRFDVHFTAQQDRHAIDDEVRRVVAAEQTARAVRTSLKSLPRHTELLSRSAIQHRDTTRAGWFVEPDRTTGRVVVTYRGMGPEQPSVEVEALAAYREVLESQGFQVVDEDRRLIVGKRAAP